MRGVVSRRRIRSLIDYARSRNRTERAVAIRLVWPSQMLSKKGISYWWIAATQHRRTDTLPQLKNEAFGPEIAVIVVVFPKEVADKWEEIERKISICVPIAITKPRIAFRFKPTAADYNAFSAVFLNNHNSHFELLSGISLPILTELLSQFHSAIGAQQPVAFRCLSATGTDIPGL